MEPRAPFSSSPLASVGCGGSDAKGCAGGWDWDVLRCTMAANDDFEMLGDARSADGSIVRGLLAVPLSEGNSQAARLTVEKGFEMPLISRDCLASNLKDST